MSDKKRSVVNIIEAVVVAVLIILIGGMLFLYFSFGNTGSAPNIFGFTIYQTKAVSMQPEIPSGAAVIAKRSEIDSIKVGSVVLCKIEDDTVLTRVVQLVSENGELSYVVKYDTAPADDTYKIPRESVIAKAMWISRGFGSLLTFATSTAGIMVVIIIPSLIIIVFQVIRIINVRRAEEDAVSLDDLNEIMIRDDGDSNADMFAEPEQRSMMPIPPNAEQTDNAVKDRVPLFTYDNMAQAMKKPVMKFGDDEPAEKSKPQTVFDLEAAAEDKPDTAENAQSADMPVEITVQETETPVPETEASPVPETDMAAFYDALTAGPQQAEAPVQTVQTVKPVPVARAVKPVPAKTAQTSAPKPKAVKKSAASISELMSMIDAEESKLK